MSEIKPVGWFNPWNAYHGYQQVAEEHEGEGETFPLYGQEAIESLRAQIAKRDELLSRWWNIGMNGAYGVGKKYPLCNHPIVNETLTLLKGGSK